MNTLKLDNPGGLLMYQDVLSYMQAGMKEALTGICKALGSNVIISGCEIAGGNISAGVMCIDDEIMAFSGGVNLGYVQVLTTSTDEVYDDSVSRPLYFTKTAISAASGTAVGDFVRLKTLKQLSSDQGFIIPFAKYHFDSGIFPAPGSSGNKIFTINHNKNITGDYFVLPQFLYTGENPGNPNQDLYRPPLWHYINPVSGNQLSLTMGLDGFGNMIRMRILFLFYRP
jgi:hypothetical protein